LSDGSVEHGAWRVAVGVAVFVLTLVATIHTVIPALLDGRLERDGARTPVFLEADEDDRAVARWRATFADIDFVPVEVLAMGVLDPTAPPPPGVERWPAPGEVFASPGLIAHPESESLLRSLGEPAGTVAPDTLADPGELLAVVGVDPARMDPEASHLIAGFGIPRSTDHIGFLGTTLYQEPAAVFHQGLVLFGWAPALALLVVALTLDAERRRHRLLMLRLLGASPWALRRAVAGEVGPPVLIGAGAVLALTAVASAGTWWLPGVRFPVTGSDIRAVAAPIVAGAALCALGAVAVALFVHRARRESTLGARPVPAPRPTPRWPLPVLAAVVLATNVGWYHFRESNPGLAITILVLGAACAVLLSPAVVGVVVAVVGRGLAAATAQRGRSASALITGRELSVLSRPAVRATTGVCIMAIIAITSTVWNQTANEPFHRAFAQYQANAGRTVAVSPPNVREWPSARQVLPESVAEIVLSGWESGAAAEVIGVCDDLMAVVGVCDGVVPESPPVRQILLWANPGAGVRAVDESALLDNVYDIVLVSTDGERLDRRSLAEELGAILGGPVGMDWPGQSWLVGMRVHADQARWIVAGAVLAFVVAGITAGAALTFEVLRVSRRVAPLGALASGRRFYAGVAGGVVGTPLAVAAVTGTVVGVSLQMTATGVRGAATMPWGLVLDMAALAVLLIVGVGAVAAHYLRRSAGRWLGHVT